MIYKIINNDTGDIIHDDDIRNVIIYALEHKQKYTYVENKKIDIVDHKSYSEETVVLVKVGS